MSKLIKFIGIILTMVIAVNCFAGTTSILSLSIDNQTQLNMKSDPKNNDKEHLVRVTVTPAYDDVPARTLLKFLLTFEDELSGIIDDSSDIRYTIQCPNGEEDVLTIKVQGKASLGKIISYGIQGTKSISGKHCSKLQTGDGAMTFSADGDMGISRAEGKVVVVPNILDKS